MSKDLENSFEEKTLLFPDEFMLSRRTKWLDLKKQFDEEAKTS